MVENWNNPGQGTAQAWLDIISMTLKKFYLIFLHLTILVNKNVNSNSTYIMEDLIKVMWRTRRRESESLIERVL